jgi:hypothetical protein
MGSSFRSLVLALLCGIAPLLAVAEGVPLVEIQESNRAERLQSSRFQKSVVSSEAERLDLAAALTLYEHSGDRGVLEGFLDCHLGSGWKAAILGNLGYRKSNPGQISYSHRRFM